MVPVAALTDRPVGRPVADHVNQVTAVPEAVPVAVLANGTMARPSRFERAPGLVTVTVLVMVHVKLAEPAKPASSVAVTVTA